MASSHDIIVRRNRPRYNNEAIRAVETKADLYELQCSFTPELELVAEPARALGSSGGASGGAAAPLHRVLKRGAMRKLNETGWGGRASSSTSGRSCEMFLLSDALLYAVHERREGAAPFANERGSRRLHRRFELIDNATRCDAWRRAKTFLWAEAPTRGRVVTWRNIITRHHRDMTKRCKLVTSRNITTRHCARHHCATSNA